MMKARSQPLVQPTNRQRRASFATEGTTRLKKCWDKHPELWPTKFCKKKDFHHVEAAIRSVPFRAWEEDLLLINPIMILCHRTGYWTILTTVLSRIRYWWPMEILCQPLLLGKVRSVYVRIRRKYIYRAFPNNCQWHIISVGHQCLIRERTVTSHRTALYPRSSQLSSQQPI